MKTRFTKTSLKTILCLLSCIMLLFGATQLRAGVTTIYPFPTSMAAGQNWTVWADGQVVQVWRADADADIANFAYSGSVTVKVRFKSSFTNIAVVPGIHGISVTKTAPNEAEFVLSDPQKSRVVVRLDNNPANDLYIWGDPPVDPAPAGAVVYNAGSHNFTGGILTLASNTTYYLAPGAVLHAQVFIPDNATNIKVLGRGIINAEFHGYLEHLFVIGDNASFIEIDGITLTDNNFADYLPNGGWMDLHQLVIDGFNAHDITIRNYKGVADFFTSDGLSFSGCYNVKVEDSFIVSADNNVVLGWEGNTNNCSVSRVVFNSTRGIYGGFAFPQGAYNSGVNSEINDFTFRDIWITNIIGTFITTDYGNSWTKVTNLLFENVYYDRIYIHDDPANSWAINDGYSKFMNLYLAPTQGGTMNLKNVHFVEDKANEGSIINGWTINFDNVYFNNRLVTTKADSKITVASGATLNVNNTPIGTVAVTGVTLNTATATLTSIGATTQLTATVAPSNATNKTVSWSSSNTAVATVNTSGLVTAGSTNGTATISVTTNDGGKTATCAVTVTSTSSNLALNKFATVSSTESSSVLGSYAFDGNASTRWASASSDPQWIYVDLGATYTINEVKLNWEAAAGKDYKIQVSFDASTWTDIKTVTGNTTAGVKDYTGLSGSGRYVRMYGTARATAYGYSLYEMEVFGTSGGTSGSLTGSRAINTTAVNLTTIGTADWKHFRNNNHKASGTMINSISNHTVVGGTATAYSNDLRNMSWTGGTPTATGTNVKTGWYIAGVNNGFSFTAPAGNGTNILYVYVGGWNSTGKLTAHLSNNAAADYVNATSAYTSQYDVVYTISYNAVAAGQTITITWVQAAGTGNVAIQGAALAGTAKSAYISDEVTQIDQINNSVKVVYPNPVSDVLYIQLNSFANTVVSIYSMTGQEMFNQRYSGADNELKLDVASMNMQNGLYILKVNSQNQQFVTKIVVKK